MKRFNLFVLMAVCSLTWQWVVFLSPMVHAEESLGDTVDCTDVRVHYVDDPTLTHEERLRLMDKAFLESLDKFELCRSAKQRAAASGAAAPNGDGAKADSGDPPEDPPKNSTAGTGSGSANKSAASSTMSGTEAPESSPSAKGGETSAQGGLEGSQQQNETASKTGDNSTGKEWKKSSGKLPEDIPSAQNDDALAAQIRYAAQNETDPVKREQLWNEYRKYKGLPTQ